MPRVLVVEDDAATRGLLTAVLTDEGYEVSSHADADPALSALRAARPDVILLDLMLHDSDELWFRKLLLELASRAEVPVVLLSATTPEFLATEGARLRVDAVIAKPFDLDTLLAEVARLARR